MCRHLIIHSSNFGHYLYVSTPQFHVSTLLQVSTLQNQVSTLLHVQTLSVPEFILWTLTFCVETSTSMCWHFQFHCPNVLKLIFLNLKLFSLSSGVDTLTRCVDTLYPDSSLMFTCVDTSRICVDASCPKYISLFSLVIWASIKSSSSISFLFGY